ncbi:MAG: PTH1 family peptidyl-tRNA hydrolase [Candidatus Midichloriaceae bacterium]|jgi:PTH1 family peptidyl-tRNA hydrolase
MKLLAGLGNFGEEYEETRHNIGFKIIDAIAQKYEFTNFNNKFYAKITKVKIAQHDIILCMPMSYMNNSGIPISKLLNFYKIPLSDAYIFHDDLDVQLGKIKIKTGGGNAGHNGLKSIDQHMGKDYHRIRIGIGRPEMKSMVSDYVLGDFFKEESNTINNTINFIVQNIELLLNDKCDELIKNHTNEINKLLDKN